jgi:dienelactone hydrolase
MTVEPGTPVLTAGEVERPTPRDRVRAWARALGTETGLARLALGVAALHVVDDNFLQPQPGTSAGDHLAGGLVQLALFVLAAWAYPRLRPGARATLAIYIGLFVAVMGIGEAGYYTRENGPSGDDYTGLLAIPAGFLLIGIGLVTLWRSRRGGSPIRRYLRRAVLALGLLLGAYFVVYPVAESYVVTHAARAYVPAAELGSAYEDIAFTTSDGLRLEGWYVPTENGATVIVFPGRKGPQAPARMLARHGYGVLLFDRRGEGESEGDPNGFGWAGTRDLEAAIVFLRARPEVDDDRIGGLGLSVGGEMLLQAAAEGDDLAAVVSEGAGIRSVREGVHVSGAERWVSAPVSALTTAATAVFASDLPPRGLTDLSAEIEEPVFFIYATPGQGGESLNRTYYDAAHEPKEIWAAEGGHTGALTAEPEEYERRVVAFFDRNLLEEN